MAQSVRSKDHNIKGKRVEVTLVETEPNRNKTSEEDAITEDKSGIVLVSDLPEGTTENGVHIHFQKKKNGGGEIKNITLVPEKNVATVVFEDIEGSCLPFYFRTQPDTKDNIHTMSFNQSDTTFHKHNMSGPSFNQEYEQYGIINQHPSTPNQYNNVNSMGPNTSREPFLEARSQKQFYQQNISYSPCQGYQQSERIGERQWSNESGPESMNYYSSHPASPHSNPHYSHPQHHNEKYVSQSPEPKAPEFKQNTATLESFGNVPNTHSYPSANETNPDDAGQVRSSDYTPPMQPCITNTDKPEETTPTEDSKIQGNNAIAAEPENTPVTAEPKSSLNSTSSKTPADKQQSVTTNDITDQESLTTSGNQIASRSKDSGHTRSKTPPSSSQSPTNDSESLTTTAKQISSPSKASGHTRSEAPPSFPQSITTDQPPADDQQETTQNEEAKSLPTHGSFSVSPDNIDSTRKSRQKTKKKVRQSTRQWLKKT